MRVLQALMISPALSQWLSQRPSKMCGHCAHCLLVLCAHSPHWQVLVCVAMMWEMMNEGLLLLLLLLVKKRWLCYVLVD